MLRLIARLDIKAPWLIKGVHLEGVRKLGRPAEFAQRYYTEGIDELLYIDAVASLYQRNSLAELVSETVDRAFVPLTVGGGIRSVEDAGRLLESGADKIAVNTAAIERPALIDELARRFGAQCVVLSVQAKRRPDGGWEAYTEAGRNHTGLDAVEWALQAAERGAGELLLTSIDREGTRRGFDVELCAHIAPRVPIPVILSGGLGDPEHLIEAVQTGRADAVAIADALHYQRFDVVQLRHAAARAGIASRHAPSATT